MTRKRKRAPGVGQYTDFETGEVRTVETSRHVKQQHKKSGTYYKQPTEKELRQWDRQDALLDRANKIKQREENKKSNAEKRTQRLSKEREAVERQYAEGKITFTQTLARKDEDQLNLHKWFGGRPKNKIRSTSPESSSNSQISCTDTRDMISVASHPLPDAQSPNLSGRELIAFFDDEDYDDENQGAAIHQASPELAPESDTKSRNYNLVPTTVEQGISRDLVDNPVPNSKLLLPSNKTKPLVNDSDGRLHNFKIPELPHRHPPNPQAQSGPGEAKCHANQNKTAAKEQNPSSDQDNLALLDTVTVENLLDGISTQDLQDYGDSDEGNGDQFEITDAAKGGDNDDDCVDDQTLLLALSSPSSSALEFSVPRIDGQQSIHSASEQLTEIPGEIAQDFGLESISFTDTDLVQIAAGLETDSNAKQNESFAMDDIEDDDLLEGLAHFERQGSSSTARRPIISRKKRVLPWDLPTQECMVCTATEEEHLEQTQES